MKNLITLDSTAATFRRLFAQGLGLAVLLAPGLAAADDDSGWSLNFTPVVLLPRDDYRVGGGTDPEVKYTRDMGPVWLSAGGRVGGYYAKNLFGVTVMPTLRVTLPLGAVDPYLAGGVGSAGCRSRSTRASRRWPASAPCFTSATPSRSAWKAPSRSSTARISDSPRSAR